MFRYFNCYIASLSQAESSEHCRDRPDLDLHYTHLNLHSYTWEVYHMQGGDYITLRVDRIWVRRDVPGEEPIASAASMKDT